MWRSGFKNLVITFLLLVQLVKVLECGRSRGSRTSGSRSPSYSSPSRPTYSSPSRPYPRPSPVHSPTYRPFPKPSPTYRPFPVGGPTHAPTYRPFPAHPATARPFPTNPATFRPFPTHSPTYRPVPTPGPTYRPTPTRSPTYRPYPTQSPTYRPFPTHSPTYRPVPTRAPTYRPSVTKYPVQPTKYPTQPRYPVGPNPIYGQGGINQGRYQPSYSVPLRIPAAGGTTKLKVYNIHNYHPSTYWAPRSYPTYSYTYRDTGSSALGFYLGYNLGRITSPTYYHHHGFYDGYSPRYDHYTVHHYYHNAGGVPKQQVVTTKVIIQCGDNSQICPSNTNALCTSNGQIMCVVMPTNTVSCKNNPDLRCAQSSVPCENTETPECKGIPKGQSTLIEIPCISDAVIEGTVRMVNNTIVSNDTVQINNKANLGGLLAKSPDLTTSSTTVTPIQNSTPIAIVTTLPTVETTVSNTTFPSIGAVRAKRSTQQYCVTVMAQPSVRKLTEGEEVFNEVKNVFEKFFSKAFGMG